MVLKIEDINNLIDEGYTLKFTLDNEEMVIIEVNDYCVIFKPETHIDDPYCLEERSWYECGLSGPDDPKIQVSKGQ